MKEKLFCIKKKIESDDVGKLALFPVSSSDIDYFKKFKFGQQMLVNTERKRNPMHHKLVFAMARCCIANAPHGSVVSRLDPYMLIKEIMYARGMVELRYRLNGDPYYVAKSISFESMDEDAFQPVSDAIVEECARILKIEEDDFRRNYINYL